MLSIVSSSEGVFDPRALATELTAEYGVSADDIALPCGQVVCTPFEGDCIQPHGQNPDLAALSSARMMAHTAIGRALTEAQHELAERQHELDAQKVENEFMRRLVERLSVDENLNILTFNSQRILYELMADTGLLDRLRDMGYTIEATFMDMDDLRQHNDLGAHEGGNMALAELAGRVRGLYRRKTDVVGILGYQNEAAQLAEEGGPIDQVGRYERGDEIIVLSFLAPRQVSRGPRDSAHSSIDVRRDTILAALQGAEVSYPLAEGSISSTQDEPSLSQAGLGYRIENGTVHATVSAAFAIVRAEIPHTREEFDGLVRIADEHMAEIKKQRGGSRGVTLNLLNA